MSKLIVTAVALVLIATAARSVDGMLHPAMYGWQAMPPAGNNNYTVCNPSSWTMPKQLTGVQTPDPRLTASRTHVSYATCGPDGVNVTSRYAAGGAFLWSTPAFPPQTNASTFNFQQLVPVGAPGPDAASSVAVVTDAAVSILQVDKALPDEALRQTTILPSSWPKSEYTLIGAVQANGTALLNGSSMFLYSNRSVMCVAVNTTAAVSGSVVVAGMRKVFSLGSSVNGLAADEVFITAPVVGMHPAVLMAHTNYNRSWVIPLHDCSMMDNGSGGNNASTSAYFNPSNYQLVPINMTSPLSIPPVVAGDVLILGGTTGVVCWLRYGDIVNASASPEIRARCYGPGDGPVKGVLVLLDLRVSSTMAFVATAGRYVYTFDMLSNNTSPVNASRLGDHPAMATAVSRTGTSIASHVTVTIVDSANTLFIYNPKLSRMTSNFTVGNGVQGYPTQLLSLPHSSGVSGAVYLAYQDALFLTTDASVATSDRFVFGYTAALGGYTNIHVVAVPFPSPTAAAFVLSSSGAMNVSVVDAKQLPPSPTMAPPSNSTNAPVSTTAAPPNTTTAAPPGSTPAPANTTTTAPATPTPNTSAPVESPITFSVQTTVAYNLTGRVQFILRLAKFLNTSHSYFQVDPVGTVGTTLVFTVTGPTKNTISSMLMALDQQELTSLGIVQLVMGTLAPSTAVPTSVPPTPLPTSMGDVIVYTATFAMNFTNDTAKLVILNEVAVMLGFSNYLGKMELLPSSANTVKWRFIGGNASSLIASFNAIPETQKKSRLGYESLASAVETAGTPAPAPADDNNMIIIIVCSCVGGVLVIAVIGYCAVSGRNKAHVPFDEYVQMEDQNTSLTQPLNMDYRPRHGDNSLRYEDSKL